MRGRLFAAAVVFCALASACHILAQQAPAATEGAAPSPGPSAPPQSPAEPQQPPGAPVMLEGREVLRLYVPAGPFSPEARARGLSERLKAIGSDPSYDETALTTVDAETTTIIAYRGAMVAVVTNQDAAARNTTRMDLAKRDLLAMREALATYRAEHTSEALVHNILFAVLALAILALAIWLTGLFSRRLARRIERWCQPGGWLGRRDVAGVFGPHALVRLALAVLRLFRWLLVAVLIYVALATVFAIFPWTRELAGILAQYGLQPLKALGGGLLKRIPDLLFIAVVCILAFFATRGLRWFFDSIAAHEFRVSWVDPEWAGAYYRIVRTMVLAGVAVIIFPYIPGSETTAFKGMTIFLGALATFGSSTAINNLINGFVLMTMRPYHLGDWVRVGETEGEVAEVSLLVTRVRTAKNVIVTVPSSQMVGSHVLNYSEKARQEGLIVHTTITIGYDAPWRKVHQLLVEAALKTRGVMAEPAPFVLQTSLDDSYVSYQINAYTRDACDQPRLYAELHENIQECFNAGGVEILSPAYHALRDGNAVTTPEAHRPPGYEAPSFRVESRPAPGKDR